MVSLNELRDRSNSELIYLLLHSHSDDAKIKQILLERDAYLELFGSSQPRIKPTPSPLHGIRDCRPTIEDVRIKKTKSTAMGARALLSSGWNFIDPINMMRKSPEEVTDFLNSVADEISTIDEMHSSRRNLFTMICDAYCRALKQESSVNLPF